MYCKKGRCDSCAHMTEVLMENKINKKVETARLCVFQAILQSLIRLERQTDGVHAAVNNDRNAVVNSIAEVQQRLDRSSEIVEETKDMIGHGFLALSQSVRERLEQDQVRDLKIIGGKNDS